MAKDIQSPCKISNKECDIRNNNRNAINNGTAKLLFQPTDQPQQQKPTDPPQQQKHTPQPIRLHPGQTPVNPSTIPRWINTFEYNKETEETQLKHYNARYNNDNWCFDEDKSTFVRVVTDLTS